jgi:hypothetical protein
MIKEDETQALYTSVSRLLVVSFIIIISMAHSCNYQYLYLLNIDNIMMAMVVL